MSAVQGKPSSTSSSVHFCIVAQSLFRIPRESEPTWHRTARRDRQRARATVYASKLGAVVPEAVLAAATVRLQSHHGSMVSNSWAQVAARGRGPIEWLCQKAGPNGKCHYFNRPCNDKVCKKCGQARPKNPPIWKDIKKAQEGAGGSGGSGGKTGGGNSGGGSSELERLRDENRELRSAAGSNAVVVDLDDDKSQLELQIEELESDLKVAKGRLARAPANVLYAANVEKLQLDLSKLQQQQRDQRDLEDRARGALGRIRTLRAKQKKLHEELRDLEGAVEEAEKRITVVYKEHDELDAEIAKLQAESKRLVVTTNDFVDTCKQFHE